MPTGTCPSCDAPRCAASLPATFVRDGSLSSAQIVRIMAAAEEGFAGCEHLVPSDKVFEIAAATRLSAYDCEFVVLAASLSVPLVTADKAVLKACPDRAMTMEAFLNG